MKKLLLCLLAFMLCGCTHDMSRKEIDEIDLILTLGIDYVEGEYSLSALYSTGGGADPEKGADSGMEEVVKGKGKSAYEALEDLKSKNRKEISLAQAGAFLIGDSAARNGIDKSLDFLSRDETIKMEALIYIIKDKSAADFIKEGIDNKQSIHEDLQALEQKQRELLTRSDNTFVNILNDIEQTYSSVLVPYLIAEESGFIIEGYAVFDELILQDYLDKDTSEGVNFIKNVMRSYSIYLKDQVNLMVSYTETDLSTDIVDENISVNIKVSFETMIKEVIAKENIFTPEELERLTEEQNNYIKAIIEKAVQYSQSTGFDILNLARKLENQNFSQWKNIKENWSNKISDVNYQVKLQSRISKSFILGNER